LNAAPSIVQNFAPIGRQSSEIMQGKKKKNKCQQNLSLLCKLSLLGGLKIKLAIVVFLQQFNNCTERCIATRESCLSDYSRCRQQRCCFEASFLCIWAVLSLVWFSSPSAT